MLVPFDLRWAPWKLAHGLMISRFCDVLHAFFTVRVVFSASRALLVHAFYHFAGLVHRELMFGGHVTFEQNFQKIVKLRIFCRSQGAVTSTSWVPGLSSLASIGGSHLKTGYCPCCGYILKLTCRCIEQPL